MAVTNKSNTPKSTKDYWRDARKELPSRVDSDGSPEICLVLSFYDGKPFFQKDWINQFTKKWTYSTGDERYWVYLCELPRPEE